MVLICSTARLTEKQRKKGRELQELILTLLRSCQNGKKTEYKKKTIPNKSQISRLKKIIIQNCDSYC